MRVWIPAWLAAVAVTYTLASIAHTQSVLAALTDLSVVVGMHERIAMTLGDLAGLHLYAVLIGLALAIALLTTQLLPRRWLPLAPVFRYVLAGAAAMAVLLLAMQAALSFTLIAGARGTLGLALQCLAGAAGGWVHEFMLRRAPAARSD